MGAALGVLCAAACAGAAAAAPPASLLAADSARRLRGGAPPPWNPSAHAAVDLDIGAWRFPGGGGGDESSSGSGLVVAGAVLGGVLACAGIVFCCMKLADARDRRERAARHGRLTESESPPEVSRKAQSHWLHDFDPPGHETQQRMGWLYNYSVCDVTDEAGLSHQAVTLLFLGEDGGSFKCPVKFRPYFYVMPGEGEDTVQEVELGLKATFGDFLADIVRIEKEVLDMPEHLSGERCLLLKLEFFNVQDLKTVRDKVAPAVQRNRRSTIRNGEYMNTESSFYHRKTTAFLDRIVDMREFDVHYHVQYSIDQGVFVGRWYKVAGKDGEYTIEADESGMVSPQPRVLAFDIETTKAPLGSPQPEIDQIYMMSGMLDGRGFLIINRAIVTEDIEDFEYTPKPAYEGKFQVWNVADEQALLRKWYQLAQEQHPHVYVTYNGDGFDFPFIEKRSEKYGINMNKEIGFQNRGNETLAEYCVHLDCVYWVNRDAYLPQGSHGLKAVAKYKLGYELLEIHHDDMLTMARENPQKITAYSVSDAVATYYLFMKYVNPFIFSLCTIIPMKPDEVLRKRSGTICEHLLMVQAYNKNVVFPNEQLTVREKFYTLPKLYSGGGS